MGLQGVFTFREVLFEVRQIYFAVLAVLILRANAVGEELWSETNTLSRALAQKFGGSESQAQLEVDRVFAALKAELLRGRAVIVLGFGSFAVQERRPRRKRGELRQGPVRKHLRFRAADSVSLELNR